jgi:uncharacterized membrane protein
MTGLLPGFIIAAIALVIILTECIKQLDRKDRLKGWRVWIPLLFSGGAAWLLRLGQFFEPPSRVWFWWAVIFAVAVFAYEAVLKKIAAALGNEPDKTG